MSDPTNRMQHLRTELNAELDRPDAWCKRCGTIPAEQVTISRTCTKCCGPVYDSERAYEQLLDQAIDMANLEHKGAFGDRRTETRDEQRMIGRIW